MNLIRNKIIIPFIVILTFLLPLKFSSIAVMPEIPLLYSNSLLGWLLVTWPTPLFNIIAGFLLLLVLIFFPFPKQKREKTEIILLPLIWILTAFISGLGFINASTLVYPILECLHFFSVAAYITSLYMVLSYRPQLKYWIIASIICGTILSCINGWEQLLSGFNETRQFVYQEELKSGVKFSSDFINRLMQNRVFANFSLCNSFAAHLILTLPLCFWGIWKICGKVDPPGLTRAIFLCAAAFICLPILYYTGSRAAFASLGVSVLLILIFLPFPHKLKIAAVFITFTGIIVFFVILTSGRGFSSIIIRFDYYQSAIKSFLSHPFIGTGWGDFFSEYPRYRQYPKAINEVPHTPHNAILAFASQTGILGACAITICLIYPIFLLVKYNRLTGYIGINTKKSAINKREQIANVINNSGMYVAVLTGWIAWSIHSMTDINIQIPGTVCTAIALVLICGISVPEEAPNTSLLQSILTEKAKIVKRCFYILHIICIFLLLTFGVRTVLADYAFFVFRDLCDPRNKPPQEYLNIPPWKFKDSLDRCIKYMPYSPFPYMTAANFLATRGRFDIAEHYVKEAIKYSPERASFFYTLACIQLKLGKRKEALRNIKKAHILFPSNPKYNLKSDSHISLLPDTQK